MRTLRAALIFFTKHLRIKLTSAAIKCAARSPRNIAEGKSEKGRPAVLNGNYFVYNDVNECGYGFEVYFYPQFMVARNTTDFETFGCFGMGATLGGVYIKKKQ